MVVVVLMYSAHSVTAVLMSWSMRSNISLVFVNIEKCSSLIFFVLAAPLPSA